MRTAKAELFKLRTGWRLCHSVVSSAFIHTCEVLGVWTGCQGCDAAVPGVDNGEETAGGRVVGADDCAGC